jgi:hypothetical protein
MDNDYSYDCGDDYQNQLDKAEMYWKGRDDGRLEASGGLYTLLSGVFIGSVTVAVLWIACSVLL